MSMDDMRPVYAALAAANADGIDCALATVIRAQGSVPRHPGSKMLVYPDRRIVGTVGGGAMESLVVGEAIACIADGQTRTRTYNLNDLAAGDPGICGGTVEVFIEPILSAPTLLVVGGGHVGRALALLAKSLDYRVILTDDRAEFCNPGYAPGLDGYVVCAPPDVPEAVTITRRTYVACVTRGLPVDLRLMPALAASPAPYIGLIGSRRRWALTEKALREQAGMSDAAIARITAPIGLAIGAETPQEIAVSILAQIIAVHRGKTVASDAGIEYNDSQ
jgi:xanthine dehydrogenase accessory factor